MKQFDGLASTGTMPAVSLSVVSFEEIFADTSISRTKQLVFTVGFTFLCNKNRTRASTVFSKWSHFLYSVRSILSPRSPGRWEPRLLKLPTRFCVKSVSSQFQLRVSTSSLASASTMLATLCSVVHLSFMCQNGYASVLLNTAAHTNVFFLAWCLFSFNSRVTTRIALWPSTSGTRVVSIPDSEMLLILLEMLYLISAVGCAPISSNHI